MRKASLIIAAMGLLGIASAASAGTISVSLTSGFNFGTFDNNTPGETSGASNTLWGPITFSTNGGSPQGAIEDTSLAGYYAQPGNDNTNYLFAAGGGSATVTWDHTLTSFDIYWGSIDGDNVLTLSNGDSITGIALGVALGFPSDGTNNHSWIQISDTTPFDAFTASSSQPAFEFDLPTAVPEPPVWGLMMLGFVGLGYASYRRKSKSRIAVT